MYPFTYDVAVIFGDALRDSMSGDKAPQAALADAAVRAQALIDEYWARQAVTDRGNAGGGTVRPPSFSTCLEAWGMTYIREAERHVPVKGTYDLIVCGGGPAGVTAAITAGRLGLRTLLIEGQGCFGRNVDGGALVHRPRYCGQGRIYGGAPGPAEGDGRLDALAQPAPPLPVRV